MDGAFDIPDPTDWNNTPLKDFSTLESALHCQICKEFYDTPMLTSCGHTFCSKCIRTSLSTDGKCPFCRANDQASKLRNNWALQEVVTTFLAARPAALDLARTAQEVASSKPGKRKRIVLDSDDVVEEEQDRRTTRSKSKRLRASQTSEPEVVEVEDSDGDGDFGSELVPDDGLVECPLGCGKRMKIEAVEPHLDRCEDERKQAAKAKSRTPMATLGSLRPSSTQNAKAQERISELNYSLLTEAKLKKKLDEVGIPNWGTKTLLVRRHTEWVNIWNANCDSNQPRSKRDLLHDLDVWERTQGGRAPGMNSLASNVMRKDFDGAGWASKHTDDFSKLIAEAKRKKINPALEEDKTRSDDVETSDVVSSDDRQAVNGVTSTNEDDRVKSDENDRETIDLVREKVNGIHASQDLPSEATSEVERANPSTNGTSTAWTRQENHAQPPPAIHGAALLEENHSRLGSQGFPSNQAAYVATNLTLDPSAGHNSGVVKKMPMFVMPQQPVTDVDGGGGNSGQ